jgi:phage shock protein PspC (stress-responsive transcriptional regulator)
MSTTSPAPGSTDNPPPSTGNRFFRWIRGLDIQRQPGWIGGVCAGIAERTGIDVLIVRGIAVVVAILGGPAILLYAAAWLLLPDRFDLIHLERLIRGQFEGAIVGIGALVILSMLPIAQGFWHAGASYWGGDFDSVPVGRILWTIILLTALVLFIVWVARRANSSPTDAERFIIPPDARPDAPTRPWPTDAATEPLVATEPTDGASASSSPTASTVPLPGPLASPPPAEDFTAWREQQEAVKSERNARRQFQNEEAHERWLQRQEARASEAARYAEQRRLRKLANPRLPGSVVAITVGLAILVGGAIGLLASLDDNWKPAMVTAGLGAATIVTGVAIVLAGAFRRRPVFLVFFSVLLLIATIVTSLVPQDRELVGAYSRIDASGRIAQAAGQVEVSASPTGSTQSVDVWQGAGQLVVNVHSGASVRVEVAQRNGTFWEESIMPPGFVPEDKNSNNYTYVNEQLVSASYVQPVRTDGGEEIYSRSYGSPDHVDMVIRVWQGAGDIRVDDESNQDASGTEGN